MTNCRPDTWMPLYWGDYLRDTGHLGAHEHGAYLLLIGHYWVTGRALPDDDLLLARIARMSAREWKAARSQLAPFFRAENGLWRHGRIERELDASIARIQQKSRAGQASAEARKALRHQDGAAPPATGQATGQTTPQAPGRATDVAASVAAARPAQDQRRGNPSSSSSPSPSSSSSSSNPVSASPSPAPSALPDFDGGNEDRIPKGALVPLAEDFTITEEMGDYALRLGWDEALMLREAEKFRAYWRHGRGAGARRSLRGWFQAWHNWLEIAGRPRKRA